MQLCVNVDEFEEQVDVVGESDATPLGDGLFDGNDLREPNGLAATFFESITQIESRPFVGEDNGDLLLLKVIAVLYVFRQSGDEGVVAHVKVCLDRPLRLAVVRVCPGRTNNRAG